MKSPEQRKFPIFNDFTDDELIRHYVKKGDTLAFEVLLHRYRDFIYRRFVQHCPNHAEDLTQELWIKVLSNLNIYKDHGKFPAYLKTIAINMIKDCWRKQNLRQRVFYSPEPDKDIPDIKSSTNTEQLVEIRHKLSHILSQLIPQLSCEERQAFLLERESLFWENKKRLSWSELASLNGIDEKLAIFRYEQARKALEKDGEAECEELLIYLVWQQSQRKDKRIKYSMGELAALSGINLSTFKTRHRTALKKLKQWLNDWEEHKYV